MRGNVRNIQIVHRVPLNKAPKWFQIIKVIVKKKKRKARGTVFKKLCWRNASRYQSWSMVLKKKLSRPCAFIVLTDLHDELTAVDHLPMNSLLTGHLPTWRYTKDAGARVPEADDTFKAISVTP